MAYPAPPTPVFLSLHILDLAGVIASEFQHCHLLQSRQAPCSQSHQGQGASLLELTIVQGGEQKCRACTTQECLLPMLPWSSNILHSGRPQGPSLASPTVVPSSLSKGSLHTCVCSTSFLCPRGRKIQVFLGKATANAALGCQHACTLTPCHRTEFSQGSVSLLQRRQTCMKLVWTVA